MNKRYVLWGGFIGVIVIVVLVMVRFAGQESDVTVANSAPANNSDERPAILEVRDDDWMKGNPDADVVVIKYSDFQCPACRFYASMDDRLSEELGDEVLFIYRHFPLQNFQFSRLASTYAEAAGRQGQFWDMHDLIYINQQRWSRSGDAETMFNQFVDSLELDREQFEADLEDPGLMDRIRSDYDDGRQLGVRSVPTVFINGEAIDSPGSFDGYRSLIEAHM